MIKYKDGLKGNLTVPVQGDQPEPLFTTMPLTAFHRRDKEGHLEPRPDPSAAYRGRNFDIENKK